MIKIATIDGFKTKYGINNLDIFRAEYADGSGQTALVATDANTGEPFSTFTVNLGDYGIIPDEGYVIIADYAENEGVIDELVKHGIVAEPMSKHSFGFNNSVEAYEAELFPVGN